MRTDKGELLQLRMAAARKAKEKNYWLDKLSGEWVKSSFPAYYKREGARTEAGAATEASDRTGKESLDSVTITFPDELAADLLKLGTGSDVRLYIILTAGLILLIYKYTGRSDIIIGTPIIKSNTMEKLINTVLVLRNQLTDDITFKELLFQVRQTISEANENRNYPIEVLAEQLNMPIEDNGFPLFDIAIVMENVHDKECPGYVNSNMIFSFLRSGNTITGHIEYNPLLHDEIEIKRISDHYRNLLQGVVSDVDGKAIDKEILSGEEKRQLLIDFNDTFAPYPGDKTLYELFEEQAARMPENIAGVGKKENVHLSYNELNERSGQLAHLLREKGILADNIVGIMLERSLDMIAGILGILKAGGAYLPIDAGYPRERVDYMLKDSGAKLLVTTDNLEALDFPFLPATCHRKPATSLAYVIYTSGTTGRPKGVLIQHQGVVNMVWCHRKVFGENSGSRISQVASVVFDAMVFEVWPCLLAGACLCIADDETRVHPQLLIEWLIRHQITISFQSTLMALQLLEEQWPVTGTPLKVLRTAGDRLTRYPTRSYPFRFYNLYGPTEDTIWTTWTEVPVIDSPPEKISPPSIGKPTANKQVYILGQGLKLQPVGVIGELCISGDGLARGYLNNPELTAEKFVDCSFYRSYRSYRTYIFYKTGDLARWLPGGNIEFIGRIDQQVKIRGFRIEPGEIESQLLTHDEIKEAIVIAREDQQRIHHYLCAYFVLAPGEELSPEDLREYLSGRLPDYMIPSYFVRVERIPLTPNGKVDRKALPEPGIKAGANYKAPGNETERELVKIWAEVLSVEGSIGINDNFFELGGQSLKAARLMSLIYKTFNVKVSLAEIFKTPTIRELSRYIVKTPEHKFAAVEPVEKKDYYFLSPAQKRLYIFQQTNKHDITYNMPQMIMLEGELAKDRLEDTLKKLIARHESFRTSFKMHAGEPVQIIHDNVEFEIEYYSSTEADFIRPFDLSRAPLLRVGLIGIEEKKYILMVDTHHIITDGSSMIIFIREFTALYAGEELIPLPIRYKDFSAWMNSDSMRESIKKQEAYWLKEFEGDVPVLRLYTDDPGLYSQSQSSLTFTPGSFEGSRLIFELDKAESESLKKLAKGEEVTLYLVLLALFNVFLFKISGQEDIVCGTITAGRSHPDLQQVIGMFVNTLALRNYPEGEKTFREFLKEVKERTLEAFENQEYPFEELAEKIAGQRKGRRNPLFDVMFSLQNLDIPRLEMPGLILKPYEYEKVVSKFDLSLSGVEEGDKFVFSFEYRRERFKEKTIKEFAGYFKDTTAAVLKDKNVKLHDIEVSIGISDAEPDAKISQEISGDFVF